MSKSLEAPMFRTDFLETYWERIAEMIKNWGGVPKVEIDHEIPLILLFWRLP